MLTGSGTIGTLNHNASSGVSPGDATLNVGTYNAADTANYYVTIDPDEGSSKISVSGNAILATNYSVYILMGQGNYPTQITDYAILTAENGITGNISTVQWIDQSGLTFNVGKSADGKSLILKSTVTNPNGVNILDDQSIADISTGCS